MSWIDKKWWLKSVIHDRVYVGIPDISNDRYDNRNKGLRLAGDEISRGLNIMALRDQSIAKYWKHKDFDKGVSERRDREARVKVFKH